MTKSKKNLAIVVALITLLVALGSIFATFGVFTKPAKTVEAVTLTEAQLAERRANPGLYETGTMNITKSWADLIADGDITASTGALCVQNKSLAGDLVCGSVDGLTRCVDAFLFCTKLVSIDCNNLDTSGVTNMITMFSGCSSLTTLFIDNFDTSNVINMNNMFSGCSALKTLDLSHFDTNKVKNMSKMFSGCMFKSLNLGGKFKINSDCDTTGMFTSLDKSLESLDLTPAQQDEICSLTNVEDRVAKYCEFNGMTTDDLGEMYDVIVAMFTDSTIYSIIAPNLANGVKVALAPTKNTHYALSSAPETEIFELSSDTDYL